VSGSIVSLENIGRNISTLVAINALVVYVEAAESVFCKSIFNVRHIVSPS
jgi:hypothetical protein